MVKIMNHLKEFINQAYEIYDTHLDPYGYLSSGYDEEEDYRNAWRKQISTLEYVDEFIETWTEEALTNEYVYEFIEVLQKIKNLMMTKEI